MIVEIDENTVMTIRAETPSDRNKLIEWIEINSNALDNYGMVVETEIE
jgi:hypothetical protein